MPTCTQKLHSFCGFRKGCGIPAGGTTLGWSCLCPRPCPASHHPGRYSCNPPAFFHLLISVKHELCLNLVNSEFFLISILFFEIHFLYFYFTLPDVFQCKMHLFSHARMLPRCRVPEMRAPDQIIAVGAVLVYQNDSTGDYSIPRAITAYWTLSTTGKRSFVYAYSSPQDCYVQRPFDRRSSFEPAEQNMGFWGPLYFPASFLFKRYMMVFGPQCSSTGIFWRHSSYRLIFFNLFVKWWDVYAFVCGCCVKGPMALPTKCCGRIIQVHVWEI